MNINSEWQQVRVRYNPAATVKKVGAWHFFIPLPDGVPAKGNRCYVRRPSGILEEEGGQRFTPDSSCIRSYRVVAEAFPNPEIEAINFVIQKRCGNAFEQELSVGSGTRECTVAEVVVSKQLGADLSESYASSGQITMAFELALHRVNQWLGAVSLAIGLPVGKVRREALPQQIPFGEGPLEPWEMETQDLGPVHVNGVFVVNSNMSGASAADSEADELEGLIDAALLNWEAQGPFVQAADLQNQAEIYWRMSGDYKVAIILYATACESLIDDLLQHLCWERGLKPHESVETFVDKRRKGNVFVPKTIKSLVLFELYPLLTGKTWRDQKNQAIEDWLLKVASVRNDIVHNAAEPSYVDMVSCGDSVNGLYEFLADAVFQNRERFPLTALAFLGQAGLSRRGEWERFEGFETTILQLDNRIRRFRRWSNHLSVLRKNPGVFGSRPSEEHGSAHMAFENGIPIGAYVVHSNETVCLELPLDLARSYPSFVRLLESGCSDDEYTVVKFNGAGGFDLPAGARWNLYTYEALHPFPIDPPQFQINVDFSACDEFQK